MNRHAFYNTMEQGVRLLDFNQCSSASRAWIWDANNYQWDLTALCYEAVQIIRKADELAEPLEELIKKRRQAKIENRFFPAFNAAELMDMLPAGIGIMKDKEGYTLVTDAQESNIDLVELTKKGIKTWGFPSVAEAAAFMVIYLLENEPKLTVEQQSEEAI